MTADTRTDRLPEDDVITVLLRQHARVRELVVDVQQAQGQHRQQAFDELRALLAVHETAEEMVLRPVTRSIGEVDVAKARNAEEGAANRMLAELEKMDTAAPDFDTKFAAFAEAVLRHAEKEEHDEFPQVRAAKSQEQLRSLSKALLAVEKLAPTHPHPGTAGSSTAQWSVGPFASLIDRARDAVSAALR